MLQQRVQTDQKQLRLFPRLPLLLLFLGFTFLYFYNLDGWLMHDDEGTDFYEVWQLQQGYIPGQDFAAEQQPLYLLTGKLIIDYFGKSPSALRIVGGIQVLLSAVILAWVIARYWSMTTAFLTLGFLLGSGMVYEQARLFRPDPFMLAWEILGLACVLLAVKQKRRLWWALAGGAYGISILWKLFGFFPVVGLIFFFLYRLGRERKQWQGILFDGFYFSGPFLLFSIGGSALLYGRMGFYYVETFGQHLSLGQSLTWVDQAYILLGAYSFYIIVNAGFVLLLPLLWLHRKTDLLNRPEIPLLVAQLLSPLIFLLMRRPMHLRYFLYLTPVLALLLAWQIDFLLVKLHKVRAGKWVWVGALGTVIFFSLVSQPAIPELLTRKETDTLALATLASNLTEEDAIVLSDYAGINFFANRRSIYEASIIAGGRIEGGVITGDLLTKRIEADNVQLVLVHVAGGEPTPHQLVNMVDYGRFREYLAQHFALLQTVGRAGQEIEVYIRN